MDNGMIFAPSGSPEADEAHRAALVKLGAVVVDMMVACGFARCQGGVMASNPRWVRTGTEWRDELKALDDGRDGERLLRAAILFDLRFVAGDRTLCEEFRADMLAGVAANEPLLRRLAELVVDTPPPLNFWGKFVVENRGGRESGFDIKNRALSPLRDAARALALKHGLTRRYSTGGRWEDIRRTQPRSAEMAALARDGYDLLLRLRTLNGLRRGDTGRFIDIASLSKLERSQLANAFDVLRMVQNSVRLEFQLDLSR
jgi:CBS domain-containing protein